MQGNTGGMAHPITETVAAFYNPNFQGLVIGGGDLENPGHIPVLSILGTLQPIYPF